MKLIFSILCIFLFNSSVSAKTYYSDYSEFTDYSLERSEASDVVNVETKRVYNKYFDVSDGDYYLLEENPVQYPYINVNIYKTTSFSDWSVNYPQDKYSRIIESRKVCDDLDCLNSHFEFRYKDRLYYHYRETAKLLGENSSLSGYIKDENDYIEYYRYQIRDKININDNIIITSVSQSITDFIDCTTDYQVIGNINYLKNGLYDISIVTSFITVPITVNVMIIDNVRNDYQLVLKDKNTLINKLNNDLLNNKKLIEDNNMTINALSSKLNISNQEIESISNKYNNLAKSKKNELENLNLKLNQSNEQLLDYKDQNNLLNHQLSILDIEIKDKINIIQNKDKSLNNLNSKINILEQKISNMQKNLDSRDDNLKKLELCNKTNNSLSIKLEKDKSIKKQDLFYFTFVEVILFLISCSVLKIKSMKKKS